MPTGFLDILATELGDYGASTGHSISKDPSDPDKVIFRSKEKISTLKRMNWQGFSSEDLGGDES
jgi:hypothetical protein